MAEILPPYIAPLYMLTSRMIALIGPNGSVRGKMIAIPSEDPILGGTGDHAERQPDDHPERRRPGEDDRKRLEKAAKAI